MKGKSFALIAVLSLAAFFAGGQKAEAQVRAGVGVYIGPGGVRVGVGVGTPYYRPYAPYYRGPVNPYVNPYNPYYRSPVNPRLNPYNPYNRGYPGYNPYRNPYYRGF